MRQRKDGRRVWLQIDHIPVIGADGTVDQVVNFAADVARKTEAARRSLRQ
ncbi:MAG: hypothetical protein R3D80_21665 [Paracoccaceae bacterium]